MGAPAPARVWDELAAAEAVDRALEGIEELMEAKVRRKHLTESDQRASVGWQQISQTARVKRWNGFWPLR
jgi:hypothetical protein